MISSINLIIIIIIIISNELIAQLLYSSHQIATFSYPL